MLVLTKNKNVCYMSLRCMSNHVKRSRFVDSLRIYVRGGPGGQGLPKFGGIGGDGGNVVVEAVDTTTLEQLHEDNPRQRFVAASGTDSRKHVLLGKPGNDKVLQVPPGVCVKNDEGRIIADLDEAGQQMVVARGGPGGSPDNDFSGRRGETTMLTLDLKLIADIGLVGFPNAGKSTFLSAISRARPKVAAYPFTTMRPHIGTMIYPDHRMITVADLPGLIEGAHANFGMGHKFLKHVERTKMLLYMVDINGFVLGNKYATRDAFQTILLLNKELELYNPRLLQKPAVLALNKIDTDKHGRLTEGIIDKIKHLPDSLCEIDEKYHPENVAKFDEIFQISAKHDKNILPMKNRLRSLLDIHADENVIKAIKTGAKADQSRQTDTLGREHLSEYII